jgi:MFS family permease
MKLLKDSNLWIILGVAFMAVTGGGIVSPLLPSLVEPLATTKQSIGLLLSVFTLFVVIFTPILGALSDKIGRKQLIVPVTSLFGIAGVLMAFTTNFTHILILRAFQGVAVAGMASLAVTIIGDLYTGKARDQAVGYRSSAHSIAFAVSPFIAGALASFNLFYPFFFFFLSIPLSIFAYFKLRILTVKHEHTFVQYFKEIAAALKNKKTVSVFYSSFHVFIIIYVLLVFVPILLAEKYSFTPFQIGLDLSVFFMVSALVSTQAGEFMNKFREQTLVVGGFLVAGVMVFVIPLVNSHFLLLVLLLVWAVAHGISFPPIYVLATVLTPTKLRAGAVAGVMTTTYLGATVSPLLFSLIYQHANLSVVFYSAGVIALIPFFLSLFGWFVFVK